jgi:hypothetical protein
VDEKYRRANPIVVVDVIIPVVPNLLKFAHKVPCEIHVGHVAEKRDVVHEKTVLVKKNFLFDIWGKLIGQGLNLQLQEEIVVIILQESFDVILKLNFEARSNTELLESFKLCI